MMHVEGIEKLENGLDELEKNKVLDPWKKDLIKIEKKYFPNRCDVDLPKKVFEIFKILNLWNYLYDQKMPEVDLKKKIKKLIKLVSNLVDELIITPDKIKELSQSCLNPVIEIINRKEFNNSWTFDSYKNDTVTLLFTLKFIQKKVMTRKGGPVKESPLEWIIAYLVSIFLDGKQTPVDLPIKNGRKNDSSGEIVDFVMETQPLLGVLFKPLGIKLGIWEPLGTRASIGGKIKNIMKKNKPIQSIT